MSQIPPSRRSAHSGAPRAGRLAALLGVAALLVSGLPGAAGPSAYILGAEFSPVDDNGNGLYEYLNITVTLQAPTNGSYLLAVTLRWPSTGTTVASASAFASLPGGEVSRLTLPIDGPKIAEKQLNGPFVLTVDLLSSPSGPVNDSATFTSPALRADQFEKPTDRDKPRLAVGDEEIQLATPTLNATVNLTRPSVRWGTPPSGAPPATFEATFPRIVAFADDGDRAYESGELACQALLDAGNWSIRTLEINSTADWGSYIRFTLGSAVTFASLECPAAPSGRLELTFLLTQRNGTAGGPTPFPIRGGLEVKVDIDLTLDGPLNASDLAFEVDLSDLSGNLSFLVRGPRGFETIPRSANASSIEPLSPALPSNVEHVAFIGPDGVARGNFSWLTLALEGLAGGQQRFVQVTASQAVQSGTMRLFLAVPNDAALRGVLLDPAVGVPAPTPSLSGEGNGPTRTPAERPSLTVFVAALAAVSAIFLFSVYARAKKR